MVEREYRAARRSFYLSLILPLPCLIVGLFTFKYQLHISILLLSLTALIVISLLIPTGRKRLVEEDTPKQRIDERDIMFSRNLLIVGSDRFEEYYENNPDKKLLDDKFREKPGLLSKDAPKYHPYSFAAADASFDAVESFHPIVEGDHSNTRILSNPGKITEFIKRWAKKIGAVSVGVTELRNYHLYSIIGRGEHYGKPVELEHKYAIALTVEMNKYMMDHAPLGPTVMESAQQYLSSGTIAVQIAVFIRNLGYPARAHIDGNYRVVCPLVARDAGLGEIGRMGLLMTPELGPRVRIAVVTTDLPLITDERRYDYSMIDFCRHCRKCADMCPSGAISFEDRAKIDGVNRWQINSEDCFTYWCTVGTDCAICVKVCPYSHANNILHNSVRIGVRNSSLFRRMAIKFDDFFYGKRPAYRSLPDWMDGQSE